MVEPLRVSAPFQFEPKILVSKILVSGFGPIFVIRSLFVCLLGMGRKVQFWEKNFAIDNEKKQETKSPLLHSLSLSFSCSLSLRSTILKILSVGQFSFHSKKSTTVSVGSAALC